VPLKDTALVSLDEAHSFLSCGADQHARLQDRINEASDLVESWCNRPLKARVFTAERVEGPWGPKLFPRFPLCSPIHRTAPVTITVDGTAQTVWKLEADGDRSDFDVLVHENHFFRRQGWRYCSYSADPYNVVLTYTGGFDPIPDELKLACFYVLQRIFGADQQKGLTEVGSLSSPGGNIAFTPRGFVMPGPAVDILQRYWIPAVA